MKKLGIVLVALLISVTAFSQKNEGKEIPPQVLNDFKAKFPAATKINWNKVKDTINVAFVNDDNLMNVKYTNNVWLKTSYEFKLEYTPQKIKDYVKQYYALYKIKTVYFTDNNLSERLYEVEIIKKKKDKIILIFDISSNFMRLGN